jgi:hypothetical protein
MIATPIVGIAGLLVMSDPQETYQRDAYLSVNPIPIAAMRCYNPCNPMIMPLLVLISGAGAVLVACWHLNR